MVWPLLGFGLVIMKLVMYAYLIYINLNKYKNLHFVTFGDLSDMVTFVDFWYFSSIMGETNKRNKNTCKQNETSKAFVE